MNDKPRFIRKNGRIIPIRSKEKKSEASKSGLKMAALATVGTLVGAELAGRMGLQSKAAARQVTRFTNTAQRYANRGAMDLSNTSLLKAGKMLKKANKFRFGATALSVGAAYLGSRFAAEGLENTFFPKEKDSTKRAVFSTAVGVPLYFVANKIVKKRAFPFLK